MALASNLRRSKPFWVAAHVTTAILLLIGARSESADAAPALRYQVSQRGDAVVFGNTLGYDCRASVPKPVVGSVDITACGANTDDNDIDVLWRSDEPAAGQATAGSTITPDMARSTAVLKLPTGAFTSYARLYWSAVAPKGMVSPAAAVLIERPGVFSKMVPADTSGQLDVLAAGTHYQQSADITSLVQLYGPGVYRVSGVVTVSPVNQADQLLYAGWSAVVFYTLKSDPPRSLALFEGFDSITGSSGVSTTLNNFLVPQTGYDAKLSIVGYQGDQEATGDRITVNGMLLTDALNPGTNILNSTHSYLGQPVSNVGDFPQTSGLPGSMGGVDMDTIDVTPLVKMGDKSMAIAISTTNDTFFVGTMVGSVASLIPSFANSLIDYTDITNPGGAVRPGDKLQFTVTAPNTGSDTAVDTYVTIPLPVGLTYVPGSIMVVNGANPGARTDKPGDDPAEYDPVTRMIKVRIGNGASPTKGGTLTNTDTPPIIQYQATVDPSANGTDIIAGGMITASGMVGSAQGIPPASWNLGSILTPVDGPLKGVPTYYPNHPLTIPVRECMTNLDCSTMKPRCDVANARCTNSCQSDNDCKGIGLGQACTQAKVCGCSKDADCLSNSCDTASRQCRIPNVDLSITVRTQPNPPQPGEPVKHVITVTNNGPDTAPPGVAVIYSVPPGGTITSIEPGPGWQCNQSGRTISCTYSGSIPPSTNAPQITITVTPDPNSKTVDVNTTVKSPGSNDPNPSNDTVMRSDIIGGSGAPVDQLAGGGFSCNIGGTDRAQGVALLAMLAMLALGLRRRRYGAAR
jgi:uncharacterized repeat protein (TIGR01451 family)/MYXO-CTERM domain-containing protein